jgi:hypothetical protein
VTGDLPLVDDRPRDHVVQFYGHDRELIETVGVFLAESLASGSPAIVVATYSHHLAFEAWLAAHGVDTVAARAGGLLRSLDASETLARIMDHGQPDADAFQDLIGEAIRQAGRGGRRVHVFGEMVALLWRAGDINAVMALESLWNDLGRDLGRQLSFSLFCGYPSEVLFNEEHLDALVAICSVHSDVVNNAPPPGDAAASPPEVEAMFAEAADSPRAARHFVIDTLHRYDVDASLIDDAALVVSELTTNALLHAHSGSKVHVTVSGEVVRIAVEDAVSALPTPQVPSALDPSGRGLSLVAALCARWGAELLDEGKVVWAELWRRDR